MQKIGLISDTHGSLHPKIASFLKDCNQIWHAGDIGSMDVAEQLRKIAPLKAVHGNIDGQGLRMIFPEHQVFMCEEVKVYMTHIGGYPGKYEPKALKRIQKEKPRIFISGHSHILKVINDHAHNLLHMNPGAAGNFGYHQKRTAIRFEIDGNNIRELEVLEVPRR